MAATPNAPCSCRSPLRLHRWPQRRRPSFSGRDAASRQRFVSSAPIVRIAHYTIDVAFVAGRVKAGGGQRRARPRWRGLPGRFRCLRCRGLRHRSRERLNYSAQGVNQCPARHRIFKNSAGPSVLLSVEAVDDRGRKLTLRAANVGHGRLLGEVSIPSKETTLPCRLIPAVAHEAPARPRPGRGRLRRTTRRPPRAA